MGNAFNNPLDESKQARMNEIISEVVGVFAKEFPLHYKDALIEQLKEEAQPEEEDDRLLPDAPTPDYELKTGTMTKRGDLVKNWKVRYFRALNEADNFRIEYFEKEGGKMKGQVNCCGYRAEEFDEDEVKEYGPNGKFGIKLVPYDSRRRQWAFSCETEEDKTEWLKVFNNACRKAKPPVNDNPLIATAFRGALKAVRWAYGFYGWYSITGTEAEMLGGLCSDILNRELIDDVIYNIPAGPQRNAVAGMVRKTVDTTVVAAVSAAWNSSVAACESLQDTLKSTASSLLTPLFEQEVALKAKIVDTVSGTVNPFLEDVGGRICRPIVRICSTPITKAYIAAINGLSTFMKKQISDGAFDKDSFDHNISWAHRSVEYWWSGPLEETNRLCWKLYTSDLGEVAAFLSGGFTAYSLYSDALDAIRDLTHRAIHKFETLVREAGTFTNMDAVLNDVLSKMVHDAKLSVKNVLNSILGGTLQEPLESGVISPCLELTKPIQDVIDSIPVPGLSDLFNLTSLVENCLGEIVDGAVGAIVDGSFGDVAQQIESTGSELGLQTV
mmetsp:Transcript_17722/g.26221  ORF Transcript_17722/g.26221 Transcript_17722/m.26221 type:complete len:555 (-) Transcript_17722:206-1870(-)|eukprot:CAMPEP_0185022850 /NCGR_PEP_ID=MMETSP1103-20130426/5537_1 /TAXON_ID=36769 /ORGANISM="Paraphysomonas bandaiensis, Strain Caron Lab Isolate" /LENGTH=554 /DNA_ID=CAMNT_0027555119 /DNA_START=98 /DNA_END=1762 /DNA_ORIENTATION=+